MAFSLLDHIQQSRQTEFEALLPAADQDRQRELLAMVLGQLIALDRANSQALYDHLHQHDHTLLWQGLDESVIQQLAALANLPATNFTTILEQLYGYVSNEITSLDEAASLGQTGVSELIQGQADYLPGTAPEQVWALFNLPDLTGHTAVQDAPVDLNASMASLNKLMMEASQMTPSSSQLHPQHAQNTVTDQSILTHDSSLDSHADDHADQRFIELPPQRPAPHFFLILEPLIALAILIGTWIGYVNLTGY